MKQIARVLSLTVLSLFSLLAWPLSLFADERPLQGTSFSESVRVEGGRLEGTVVSVRRNGDEFILRTGRDTMNIDARGGVAAWYRGQRFRIRDLEPGDRVAVDLAGDGRWLRARSVEVLRSVSHDGYSDGYDSWGDKGRDFLQGRVVSIDGRRDTVILRTRGRDDVLVDTSRLDRGPGDWERNVRIGDVVSLRGRYDGRTFVALRWEQTGGAVYDNRR